MTRTAIGGCAWLLLLACSDSHGPSAGTSGSNWLTCEKLADCEAEAAVTCSGEGFCLDAQGERILADGDEAVPPDDMRGDAAPVDAGSVQGGPCIWDSAGLLAQVGAKREERRNCGRYPAFDSQGVVGGFACFTDATITQNLAAELSVNTCVDCYLLMTYVASTNRGLFVIRRERDSFGGDDIAEVSIQSCDQLSIQDLDSPVIECMNAMDRYRCSEPASDVPEEEPALPVQPLKLGDVSAPGNAAHETLHLYVNNQSYRRGAADVDVYIDDQHVVTGDFDVGGPRDRFETTIQVPAGSHRVRVFSRTADTDAEQIIEMSAERWAVIDYWDEPPEAPRLTFTLHEEPVSFE